MGFFATVRQVCSGTSVFVKLLECRFRRALWHLLLLIVLLALALAGGHTWRYAGTVRTMCRRLFGQIGGLCFSPEQGVRTLKNPLTKQSYRLDDKLRFDYCPGHTLTEADLENPGTPFRILCLDRGFVFWAENYGNIPRGKLLVAPAPLDFLQAEKEPFRFGLAKPEFYAYLKSRFELRPGEKLQIAAHEETAKSIAGQLLAAFFVMIFFLALLGLFVWTAGAVLFFSAMQFFWNAASEKKLSCRQIAVALIYVAFPPLLIASLYTFAAFPGISPQLVFLAAFFAYYLAVFRKIRLTLARAQGTGQP